MRSRFGLSAARQKISSTRTDPQAQGFIISYGGRASRADAAQKAASKAMDYLVDKRGLEAARVVILDGGSREQPIVEPWVVPSGAQPPKPAPTLKPGESKPANPAKPKSKKS